MAHHSSDTRAYVDECIGPRVVGTRYRSHYWGDEVTVLAVDRNPPRGLWSITEATDEELARRTSRTHCTAWEFGRDQVVS